MLSIRKYSSEYDGILKKKKSRSIAMFALASESPSTDWQPYMYLPNPGEQAGLTVLHL